MPTPGSPYAGLTPDEFKVAHPQFRQAGDNLIGIALAKAAEQWDPTACGRFYEQIVEYTACDLLATGAYGQILPVPLPKNQRNIYKDMVDTLVAKIPKKGLYL